MTTEFIFSTRYVLDKTHFSECYDESVTTDTSIRAYYKSIGLVTSGVILIFSPIDKYLAWFILSLGVVEALSVYYNKAWWLMRQRLSKASGNTIQLMMNEEGIFVKSDFVDVKNLWTEINEIKQTKKGFLLKLNKSTNYISNRCLSEEAKHFIINKASN
ncbi:hypothetical protein CJF42_23015 [Pseudoalteromonas sp. NBT06-2]|uniref:YcxB family protein n=1 Tax=Pseudoalteromonas sp. NBT06-2 TaxID=2025950 RepID=UPI000BA77EC7|nr:YcxB family protein [Pseudoalteromonas sp. NBT06-2]PAJ72118.1 hypothetical protein CJF42_23015 [Pseudoalteromonas sp. NBT06-2]